MMPLLEMKGITKIYPGVVANYEVDLSIEEGEIHALIGENGAGKSTLMNILFGKAQSDKGEIRLRGTPVKFASPLAAIEHGVGMVHQHFMLAEDLTVAENIILGREPARWGVVNYENAKKQVNEAANRYNFKLDADKKVSGLSVGAKQKVEILKALIRGSRILILDEPTAVLTPQETEELFAQLTILKKDGYTIVFISHKLDEIKKICDRGTVMRRGKVTGTFHVSEVSIDDMSRLMIGRVVSACNLEKPEVEAGEVVLEVKKAALGSKNRKAFLQNINFFVRSGEILGIAGVEGNGQEELVQIVTGFERNYIGKVYLCGQDIMPLDIDQIRKIGLSYIPEDRMVYGAAKDASISDNMISTMFTSKELSGRVLQKPKAVSILAEKLVKDFNIKTNSAKEHIGNLSGGNIQKVVVARELVTQPKLLVANQPTRGIDMGASMYIRQRILDMKKSGSAIILLSADMSELLTLSDSIMVMYGGGISAFFSDMSSINEETLGRYMLGVDAMDAEELERGMGYEHTTEAV